MVMKIRRRKHSKTVEPGDPDDDSREIPKEILFETIRTQIRNDDPPETALTLDRLCAEGHSEEEAMTLIGCALSVEIFEIMKNGGIFDLERSRRNLERLPALPF